MRLCRQSRLVLGKGKVMAQSQGLRGGVGTSGAAAQGKGDGTAAPAGQGEGDGTAVPAGQGEGAGTVPREGEVAGTTAAEQQEAGDGTTATDPAVAAVRGEREARDEAAKTTQERAPSQEQEAPKKGLQAIELDEVPGETSDNKCMTEMSLV